ncbi:MAG: hypothetical protein ACK4GL_12520 [Flavobacteriales bacterium]
MSTAELKINLINRITQLNDANLVKQIKQLLDFEINEQLYKLSEEQLDNIREAKEEYASGKILLDKQANSEI